MVANSTLCQVEKLSSCVQPCQPVVNGHLWPLALSLAAASATSGQVVGGLSGSSPAALKASLLIVEDRGRAVEREAQHLRRWARCSSRPPPARRRWGRTCRRRPSSPCPPARWRPCWPSWSRCRPRTPAGCAARCRRGRRRSRRSSTRRSCPCRSARPCSSFWLALKSLARSLTHSSLTAVIECHHWISVWACAGSASQQRPRPSGQRD